MDVLVFLDLILLVSMTRVLRRLNFSRQKARPHHPKKDPEAQEDFKKGGLAIA